MKIVFNAFANCVFPHRQDDLTKAIIAKRSTLRKAGDALEKTVWDLDPLELTNEVSVQVPLLLPGEGLVAECVVLVHVKMGSKKPLLTFSLYHPTVGKLARISFPDVAPLAFGTVVRLTQAGADHLQRLWQFQDAVAEGDRFVIIEDNSKEEEDDTPYKIAGLDFTPPNAYLSREHFEIVPLEEITGRGQ